MEQDHLPCSCDQEVFERVWRRVMPEDRPDCPFTLGEDAAAPPAIQPPAVALPAVVHTAPAGEQAPSRPVVGEEHDVPCLGASSAVYGAQLQRLIDRELADWRAYQALSRRPRETAGGAGHHRRRRTPPRQAAFHRLFSHLRGAVLAGRPGTQSIPHPFSAALREHFMEEQRGRPPTRPRRRDCRSLPPRALSGAGGEEDSHAWLLRSVLEQL
ncbi:MAG: rubrerythrin [Flavonifractor plautii]